MFNLHLLLLAKSKKFRPTRPLVSVECCIKIFVYIFFCIFDRVSSQSSCASTPIFNVYVIASGDSTPGSVRTSTCAANYSGLASNIVCESNGEWSFPTGCICELSCNCPENPVFNGYNVAPGDSTPGSERMVTCWEDTNHGYAYIRTYILSYIHTFIHTYIHIHTQTYIHAYMHTYIHTYIHTYNQGSYNLYRRRTMDSAAGMRTVC
jgi:hypothetical protein